MKKTTTLLALILYAGYGQAQWSLTGNAGTNPSTNFIGTTDPNPLIFKTNRSFSGIIDPNNRNNAWGHNTWFTNSGLANNAFGGWALYENTSGSYNVAFGNYAMAGNLTGNYNTAIGAATMQFNENEVGNTALGYHSLGGITGGSENTAVGHESLYFCDGPGNTAVGYRALYNGNNSSFNTAIEGSRCSQKIRI